MHQPKYLNKEHIYTTILITIYKSVSGHNKAGSVILLSCRILKFNSRFLKIYSYVFTTKLDSLSILTVFFSYSLIW